MNKTNEQHAKHELQAACFALHELVLYLDTHPDCRKAMQMYHTAKKRYKDLYAQYEANYGPLTANGVTGDEGEARIIKVASTYLVGKWERLVSPSPRRLSDPCSAFPRCGGCAFCHVDYALERQIKTDFVKNTFRKSGLRQMEITAPAEELPVTGYRNKALIPIARNGRGEAYAGFFAPNTHRAVPCENCLLQPPIFARITAAFVDFVNRQGIPPYEETTDSGVIRHLYLRSVQEHTKVMLCAVVKDPDAFPVEEFTAFAAGLEGVESVYLNVQKESTNVVLGDECRHLLGKTTLRDTLCSLDFEISPLSFYQINHACASLIHQRAAELAEIYRASLEQRCEIDEMRGMLEKITVAVFGNKIL